MNEFHANNKSNYQDCTSNSILNFRHVTDRQKKESLIEVNKKKQQKKNFF
uniref:Uncharacterized protein n=1 Tax=Meloidogyne enterolobii TaxID=390850 RepID=A0A6V7VF81_MELEN|nr:unnamed protein product [Meloidogyne enterolobii]